jgi:pimeloyl-ACP methyl ester carboxylesterase
VFLHGLLDSSEGWTRICEQLSGTRVAIDLPGFGFSDPPSQGSIAGYARDVAEALEAIGLERCTIVGHSLGGAVAAALTELSPDRVTGLVLLAPAGFGRIHLAEAISVPGVRNVVQAALPFALSSGIAVTVGYMTMVSNGRTPERGVVGRVTSRGAALVHGAREGTRAVVDAGRAPDGFHQRRLAFSGPVFAVWGNHDRLVPTSHRHGVRRAFPQVELELWSGMGHHPVRERFDDLLALIVRAAAATQPRAEAGGAGAVAA